MLRYVLCKFQFGGQCPLTLRAQVALLFVTSLTRSVTLLLFKFQFAGRQGPPANSCLNVVQNPKLSPDTINNASNRAVMLDDCRITSHELPAGASRQTAT